MRRSLVSGNKVPFIGGMSDAGIALAADQVGPTVTAAGSYVNYSAYGGPAPGKSVMLTGAKGRLHTSSGPGKIKIYTAVSATLIVRAITPEFSVSGTSFDITFPSPLPLYPSDVLGWWVSRAGGDNVIPGLYTGSGGGILYYTTATTLSPFAGSDLDNDGWYPNSFGAGSYAIPLQVRGYYV